MLLKDRHVYWGVNWIVLLAALPIYQRKSGVWYFRSAQGWDAFDFSISAHPLAHSLSNPSLWTQVDTSESTMEWCFVDGAFNGAPNIVSVDVGFGRQVLLRSSWRIWPNSLHQRIVIEKLTSVAMEELLLMLSAPGDILMKLELKVDQHAVYSELTMDILQGSHLNYGSWSLTNIIFHSQISSGVWAAFNSAHH